MNALTTYARLLQTFAHFAKNDDGATAIEYALIAGGIAMAIITTVYTFGTSTLLPMYQSFATLFS